MKRFAYAILMTMTAFCFAQSVKAASKPDVSRPKPLGLTVTQAIKKFGTEAKSRLQSNFVAANVPYPPAHFNLVCFKDEGILLLFAKDKTGKLKRIKSYNIVSNSGVAGPKLKEGDLQIPEGFYKITGLDAMTHLAMWVNYPNAFDRSQAISDRRTKLGGYIQIHGGVFSTGCIVISNEDMAELLVAAYDVGYKNVNLIIAPCNLSNHAPSIDFSKQPGWVPLLYKNLKLELEKYPLK